MSPADQVSLFFSIKIFRFLCQKEEDLLPLFHKMLEGLVSAMRLIHRSNRNVIPARLNSDRNFRNYLGTPIDVSLQGCAIGLCRENAIAIQKESGDSNGRNV